MKLTAFNVQKFYSLDIQIIQLHILQENYKPYHLKAELGQSYINIFKIFAYFVD